MIPIPESHADLLTRALPAVLVTVMPDGRPQASVVWVDAAADGADTVVTVNTELEPVVVHAYG